MTWNGEASTTTVINSGIPQGSPLSTVLFLIGVAKVYEDADLRIHREITSHTVQTYSYVDDFHCTARKNPAAPTRRGRQPEAITAARKARQIVPRGGHSRKKKCANEGHAMRETERERKRRGRSWRVFFLVRPMNSSTCSRSCSCYSRCSRWSFYFICCCVVTCIIIC